MKKALFVGLGGSGTKTLLSIQERLWKSFIHDVGAGDKRDQFSQNYQFVTVDTDRLASSEAHMNLDENLYRELPRPIHIDMGEAMPRIMALNAKRDGGEHNQRLKQFVGRNVKRLPARRINEGAGAYRMNSRLGLHHKYDYVVECLNNAIRKLTSIDNNQVNPEDIHSYVISSLAGGTGSGILLDILYLIDRLNLTRSIKPFPILFAPNGYLSTSTNPNVILSNGFAAMQEISYFNKSEENEFKHVSVQKDQAGWEHDNLRTFTPYKAALVVDTELQNGSSVPEGNLYPVIADMVVSAILKDAGAQANSVIDNIVQDAGASSDKIVSFGCLTIKKPINYFREYLESRWKLQVISAMVGKEGIIKDEDKIDWISKLVESLVGKLFASTSDEERLLKNQALCSDSSAVDCSRGLDLQKIYNSNGVEITNLRQCSHTAFASNDAASAHARIGQSYGEQFLDEKGKFNAPSDLGGFRAECYAAIEKAVIQFKEQINLLNPSATFKLELKKWLGRSIAEKGVIATHELVEAVDVYLDSHVLENLYGAAEFLNGFRNNLKNQIDSVLPDDIKKGRQSAADSLLDQMSLYAASEQYLSLVEAQINFIQWLCQAERGWLDQEVEYRLLGLRGHLSAMLQAVKKEYEITIPKKFSDSARDATTRFIPDIKTYVDGHGKWVDDRDCQFASCYFDLLKDPEKAAVSLLNQVNDSASDRTDARVADAYYFGDILEENAGGQMLGAERVVNVVVAAVANDLAFKLIQHPNSLAGKFLDIPLWDLYKEAGNTKKDELKRWFGQENFQYFPTNPTGPKKTELIFTGGNKEFAKEVADMAVQEIKHYAHDSNQLVKFTFKGGYNFSDYRHYAGCKGEYRALLENQEEDKHNPHIYAGFFCQGEVGKNVEIAMESLTGGILQFDKGVETPYDDFKRTFSTLWLYHLLPQYVSPDDLLLVYKQAFIARKTMYSPFSIYIQNNSMRAGWLNRSNAIEVIDGLIHVPERAFELQFRMLSGDYIDCYLDITKHADSLQDLLKDFEIKMIKLPHRNLLATGLEQACHKIQEEMSLIANRRDVNNEKMELAEEIATLCDPKNRVGIIDHIGTNIFGS